MDTILKHTETQKKIKIVWTNLSGQEGFKPETSNTYLRMICEFAGL